MVEILFTNLLVMHIIFVIIAVGTVTVTDYLHLLGINNKKVKKRSIFIFPHLSKLILSSLIGIYLTGFIMVLAKPEILDSSLFLLKVSLVIIVTINGFVLHHKIFPKIQRSVKKNYSTIKLLRKAAFAGSLSLVSWYGIVILSLTKGLNYTPLQFIAFYLLSLIIAYLIAIKIETRNRE